MTPEELLADGCLSVKQAAEFLSIGLTSTYAEMESGRLAYLKIGRRRVVPKKELIRFAAAQLTGGWAIIEPQEQPA